jgi:predicted nucleic acid-binding protein
MLCYYLDTSIWLDFLENRNEPNLQKGKYAKLLIEKVVANSLKIIYSEIISKELRAQGYQTFELDFLFLKLKGILYCSDVENRQIGKAKDLAEKRGIPFLDALHALIARDNKAIMVTRDTHFRLLRDIVDCRKPEELT